MNEGTGDGREWISALADGQCEAQELAARLDVLVSDPQARQAWQTYHLVGDVLRSRDLAPSTDPAVFLERLSQRLSLEPVAMPAPQAAAMLGGLRWKYVVALATLAVVTALAWWFAAAA